MLDMINFRKKFVMTNQSADIVKILDTLDNNLVVYMCNLEYDKLIYMLNQDNDFIYFFNRKFDDPLNKKISTELKYMFKLISVDEWNKIRFKIKKSYINILKMNNKKGF